MWFKKCNHVIIFREAFTSNWELFGSNSSTVFSVLLMNFILKEQNSLTGSPVVFGVLANV